MSLVKYIKKIMILCTKINNPPFFIYSCLHYLKKFVPFKVAACIAENNKMMYLPAERDFSVSTYDGSNQAVHPDIIFFDFKYWLVVTPYPYGMEEYENPCVYCGESIDSMYECTYNPIAIQKKHEIGFHLSDPCFFEVNGRLACGYRENTHEKGKKNSYIYIKIRDKGGIWSSGILVNQSYTDLLLSPAFYTIDNHIHMIHVKMVVNGSRLVHSELNEDMKMILCEEEMCSGIPDEYYIWHIAIAFEDGRKKGTKSETLFGLFLLRNKIQENNFVLYKSKKDVGECWEILKEVKPQSAIIKGELHPYKSSFIPNSLDIMYSYIDKRHRYRLTILKQ